jgi:transcriptional regulator with XRE-family HTH domain
MSDTVIGDWVKFGSIIRTARQRQQLSQHQLAARAEVSRSWLAKVELGHRGAEFEQILRLLNSLGMTLVIREPGANGGTREAVSTTLTDYFVERDEASARRRRSWQAAGADLDDRTGRDED